MLAVGYSKFIVWSKAHEEFYLETSCSCSVRCVVLSAGVLINAGLDKVAMEMELRFGFCHTIAYRLRPLQTTRMTIQNNFKPRT
jgi:hypothetical protein